VQCRFETGREFEVAREFGFAEIDWEVRRLAATGVLRELAVVVVVVVDEVGFVDG